MTLRYLLLFSVAVLSILRPSHVKPVDAASVTPKMKATTAVALVGFATLQRVNAGYDCRNAPTGDPTTQCGANECCSLSETCSGVTNTACPPKDSDINVSCWACCGNSACDQAEDATIGVRSCNGDSSCKKAFSSNIGDKSCRGDRSCYFTNQSNIGNNSCRGDQSCDRITGAKIGNDSCIQTNSWHALQIVSVVGDQSCVGEYSCAFLFGSVGQQSCVGIDSCNFLLGSVGKQSCVAEAGCSSSKTVNIGDNSCNTYYGCFYAHSATIGSNSCNGGPNIQSCWFCQNSNVPSNECNYLEDGWGDSNGQYNYCIYCSNCKDQATGQSCFVSVLSSTIHTTSSSSNENDTDCSKLNETITEAFKAINNEALKELIGKYIKSEVERDQNLCTIKLALMFEHLNKEKLEPICEALQTFFSNHVEEFKKNHPRFTEMIFSCEPKDQNANEGKEPKKSKNGKKTKNSKNIGKEENKRIHRHLEALVAQY